MSRVLVVLLLLLAAPAGAQSFSRSGQGQRCQVGSGPRAQICWLNRSRPLGASCTCPQPSGRVIR